LLQSAVHGARDEYGISYLTFEFLNLLLNFVSYYYPLKLK